MSTKREKNNPPQSSSSTLIQIESQDQGDSLFPYLSMVPDPKLLSQGWERRFMVGPDRVQEANQLYQELGFEILNEPVKPSEFNDICQGCQTLACDDYVIIYTRKTTSLK